MILLPGRTGHTCEIIVVYKVPREAVMFAQLILWPESHICLKRHSGAEMNLSVLDMRLMLWVFKDESCAVFNEKNGELVETTAAQRKGQKRGAKLATQKQLSK